jgi:hypothetical protein
MTSGDAPNIPADVGINLAGWYDTVTVPLFASTTARDAAYATTPFGLCFVGASVDAGTLYRRRGGSWYEIKDVSALIGDTGWKNCTIASGFGANGSQLPRARVMYGIVYLDGGFSATGMSTGGNHTVGSLPSAIAGPASTLALASGSAGNNTGVNVLSPGGSIIVRPGGTLASYYTLAGISYPAS